jgi:hypothetical protein
MYDASGACQRSARFFERIPNSPDAEQLVCDLSYRQTDAYDPLPAAGLPKMADIYILDSDDFLKQAKR